MKRRQDKVRNTAVIAKGSDCGGWRREGADSDDGGLRSATRMTATSGDGAACMTCVGGDSSKGGNYNNYGGRL
jgi:hypothetical protein